MLRPALLAGSWYPADEGECRAAIETHAADARPEQGPWRGLIGPHAGWYYSGDAAAGAYRWLAERRAEADLVVVFGSHRGSAGPNTILRAEGWETPVGSLHNAQDIVASISGACELLDEPVRPRHPDNAVELHMPFVRYFFPRAEVVVVGVAADEVAIAIGRAVAEVVAAAGRDAVYIGSTDLTHYGPNYHFEPHGPGSHGEEWVRNVNDAGFIGAVLRNDPQAALLHANRDQSACCAGAAAATLAAVGTCKPQLVDHYLSCDVRPASSFVGYAGIVL